MPPAGDTMGDAVRLDVGPVAPASAVAWMAWADEAFESLSSRPASGSVPSSSVFVDAASYLQRWMPSTGLQRALRWQANVDPDELEYLVHAFFNLDTQLSDKVGAGVVPDVPEEGRIFYLVLVRAILHALETDSPGRAAFVSQLRSSWPVAADAT